MDSVLYQFLNQLSLLHMSAAPGSRDFTADQILFPSLIDTKRIGKEMQAAGILGHRDHLVDLMAILYTKRK